MIIATATTSASRALHHTAPSSHAAAPVPAMTGAMAFGRVRGRAPSTHCARLATTAIVARPGHRALPRGTLNAMDDRLSKHEIRKDALQETAQSVAETVGEVTTIITTAIKDVAGALGGLATDVFEIRDGVRRAGQRTDDTVD